MTDLFSKIDEDTLKQLAKRYHKVLAQRNNNGVEIPSLMEIQENLARAVGHKNMHAAQAYWDTHKNRNTQPEKVDTSPQEATPPHPFGEKYPELLKSVIKEGSEAEATETLRSVIKESAEAIAKKWDNRGGYYGFERFAVFDLKTLYHEVYPRLKEQFSEEKFDAARLYDLIDVLVLQDETIKKIGHRYTTVASYEASEDKVKLPQNVEVKQQQNTENSAIQKKFRP